MGVTEAQRTAVTHQTLQVGEADQRNPMQPKAVAQDLLDHRVDAVSQGVAVSKRGGSTRGEAGGAGGGWEGRERGGGWKETGGVEGVGRTVISWQTLVTWKLWEAGSRGRHVLAQ